MPRAPSPPAYKPSARPPVQLAPSAPQTPPVAPTHRMMMTPAGMIRVPTDAVITRLDGAPVAPPAPPPAEAPAPVKGKPGRKPGSIIMQAPDGSRHVVTPGAAPSPPSAAPSPPSAAPTGVDYSALLASVDALRAQIAAQNETIAKLRSKTPPVSLVSAVYSTGAGRERVRSDDWRIAWEDYSRDSVEPLRVHPYAYQPDGTIKRRENGDIPGAVWLAIPRDTDPPQGRVQRPGPQFRDDGYIAVWHGLHTDPASGQEAYSDCSYLTQAELMSLLVDDEPATAAPTAPYQAGRRVTVAWPGGGSYAMTVVATDTTTATVRDSSGAQHVVALADLS